MQKHQRFKFYDGLEDQVSFNILRWEIRNEAPIWASQLYILYSPIIYLEYPSIAIERYLSYSCNVIYRNMIYLY